MYIFLKHFSLSAPITFPVQIITCEKKSNLRNANSLRLALKLAWRKRNITRNLSADTRVIMHIRITKDTPTCNKNLSCIGGIVIMLQQINRNDRYQRGFSAAICWPVAIVRSRVIIGCYLNAHSTMQHVISMIVILSPTIMKREKIRDHEI